jgi:glycerol kinase
VSVLAIDAGTTGVTALVVTETGTVASRGYAEFSQFYPVPGWVEQLPDGLWRAVLAACAQALTGTDPAQVSCVGLANQRETAVVWDRATLVAPHRAIVWQDRRSAGVCERLAADGLGDRVSALTGLRLDPYFTATKLAWLADNDPQLWAGVTDGALAVGTVDAYLMARLTGGRRHVTDPTNASRTLLFDLEARQWSAELCQLFRVPPHALPEVVPSSGVAGHTDPAAFLGLSLPVAGIAGDQQAALFGQACFAPGSAKCTYGTGSFVLVNTGQSIIRSRHGLLSTIAWADAAGNTSYALEGSVFVTGAAIQWLRDGLGVLTDAAHSEELARSVPDSGGVVFVPALTGLGAPDWDPDARGAIFGLTRGTTRAHLTRAALDAITFEVRDVMEVIGADAAAGLTDSAAPAALRVDGGASGNDLLMQLQADQLQRPVERPVVAETTALGAAFLAGLGTGVWSSLDELAATWRLDHRFSPGPADAAAYRRWRDAVARGKGWARARQD